MWTLATATNEAQVRFERTVPERTGSVGRGSQTTFAADIAAELGTELEPALADAAEARTSPIAASIDRVLLADAVGERLLIVIGDGRERAAGLNLECGRVWTRRFRSSLDRRGILPEDSLREPFVRIEFARFAMERLRGRSCRATVARERAIREVWTALLTDAGAASVAFRSGHAELDFEPAQSDAPRAEDEQEDE